MSCSTVRSLFRSLTQVDRLNKVKRFAGKRMYRHCSIDAYRSSIHNRKDGFWLKFSNFMSDHAVGWRGIQPLADIETQGWDQHGKML